MLQTRRGGAGPYSRLFALKDKPAPTKDTLLDSTPCLKLKRISQKLKDHILTKATSFGLTQNGRDWCTKALHPSDPITDVRGIPDESSVPSMFMNYQSVYTVSPNAAATGSWRLEGQLIPNPLSFGACKATDSVGDTLVEFSNKQIDGSTQPDRLASFLQLFKRWRLAYASVTIYQDGPDLANQGTVVVCQKPVDPIRVNVYETMSAEENSQAIGLHHAFHLEASDLPDYTNSQAMPNAYFGKSKDGAYIPLKLTQTHQKWHSARDLMYQCTGGSLTAYTQVVSGGQLNVPSNVEESTQGLYPFYNVNDLHIYVTGVETPTKFPVGTLMPDFCNENWADFSFRNMAPTTSLSFFFRFGFEVQTDPSSSLAPHLRLSPEYDPAAISTYFAVSRELKDAYPADYNDLGKIWDVISSVAKKVSPFLGGVPVAGPILQTAVPMLAQAGDSIRAALKRTQGPTRGSVASASDIEIAKDYAKIASVPPPVPSRVGRPPLPRRPVARKPARRFRLTR